MNPHLLVRMTRTFVATYHDRVPEKEMKYVAGLLRRMERELLNYRSCHLLYSIHHPRLDEIRRDIGSLSRSARRHCKLYAAKPA